jgi:hypothetical protein
MSKSVSATYISSDAAVGVEVGFVPDHVKLTTAVGGTELVYDYYRILADTTAGTGQFGILDTGGTKSTPSTAATGIIPLSSSDVGVLIESPQDSGKQIFASATDWLAATDYSSAGVARSATTIGTIVRPPVHINRVFELTTATGVGTSEPATWDVQPGETVTDGGSNIWTCRDENVTKRGVNGFEVGVTVCTNGEIHVYEATQNDVSRDQGDADLDNPVRL